MQKERKLDNHCDFKFVQAFQVCSSTPRSGEILAYRRVNSPMMENLRTFVQAYRKKQLEYIVKKCKTVRSLLVCTINTNRSKFLVPCTNRSKFFVPCTNQIKFFCSTCCNKTKVYRECGPDEFESVNRKAALYLQSILNKDPDALVNANPVLINCA